MAEPLTPEVRIARLLTENWTAIRQGSVTPLHVAKAITATLDAARAAVSSGEPFHESRYREHDDEGNHIWDHPVSPAPVPAAGLPPPDPSLIGTEYHPISIDGGRYRPPITEEIRLLRQRFPEVVAAIEAAAVRELDELREAAGEFLDEFEAAAAGDIPLDGHYQRQALARLRSALHREDGT